MLANGLLPVAAAWLGKRLVDAVVHGGPEAKPEAILLLVAEGVLMAGVAISAVTTGTARQLLGLRMGDTVRAKLVDKSSALPLSVLEESGVQDQLNRARKQAASRPVMALERIFSLLRGAITFGLSGVLLYSVHPAALVVIVLASLPGFFLQLRHSKEQYALAADRTVWRREQGYLENILSREDHAKEVRSFGLAGRFRKRFEALSETLFDEHSQLAKTASRAAAATSILTTSAFYVSYGVVVMAAIEGFVTIGEMTMTLALFRQCQNAVSNTLSSAGGLVQDQLFMADLFAFLDRELPSGNDGFLVGTQPGDG
ncbi:MAG: ABC transporter ATP-binding protein, partial [Myxococcales bacterium]|nr:ABC transporter ATP-binding protein [Myxococcales bacterium]